MEFYQGAIDLFPPVPTTGSTKAVHVLSCLCDNVFKRSLAICSKSRASCPISRLLSVPIWPACAEQGRQYDSNEQNKQNQHMQANMLLLLPPVYDTTSYRILLFMLSTCQRFIYL